MGFNLFGDLAAALTLADRAVHEWWPDVPGTVGEVRFAHSPGRLDPAWLGNLVAFDVGFVLDLGGDAQGLVGVVTAYHDVNRRQPPKPSRLPRYREITETSGIFGPEAIDAVNGTDLIHIWLDHLLVLSMLQHPSRAWRWGPARRRLPRRQHGLRRRVQALPGATGGPVDVRLRDGGGAPRRQG